MDRRKLAKLKAELTQMRRGMQKASDVQGIAKQLGRKLVNRGKHPMWESEEFPYLRALSIPDHSGKDFGKGLRNILLGQLEDDIIEWEQRLPDEDDKSGEE